MEGIRKLLLKYVTSEKYLAPLCNKIAGQHRKEEFRNTLINFSLCIFRSKLLSNLLPFRIYICKSYKITTLKTALQSSVVTKMKLRT